MPQLEYAATSSWMHLKLFLPHFQLRCQFVTNYKSDCETNPCVKIFKGNVWEIPSLFLSTLPPFEKIKRVRGQRERNWCRESGNEKVGACLRPPCPRYLGDGGMLPLTQGSASFWPAGQIWSLLVFINKVYWGLIDLTRDTQEYSRCHVVKIPSVLGGDTDGSNELALLLQRLAIMWVVRVWQRQVYTALPLGLGAAYQAGRVIKPVLPNAHRASQVGKRSEQQGANPIPCTSSILHSPLLWQPQRYCLRQGLIGGGLAPGKPVGEWRNGVGQGWSWANSWFLKTLSPWWSCRSGIIKVFH